MVYYSFNQFLRERFGERVQKITLDAGLTCPNRDGTKGTGGCIYCDTRGSGNSNSQRYPDIKTQVETGKNFLAKRYKARKFIAYFQSFCNTYAPPEQLKNLYDQAVSVPGVVGLSIATRPDCLSEQVLDLIAGYADRLMVWLELGLQSSSDATLKRIHRGHTFRQFIQGYELARKYPLLTCVHIILGLPGETHQDMQKTARDLSVLHPAGVKIHSLYVSKNTALEKMYRKKKFIPFSREDFVASACDTLEILPETTVIHRLTGDPRPEELVAPQWTLEKNRTLDRIIEEMKRRNSRQGKKNEHSRNG